jgi:hypothetical protein
MYPIQLLSIKCYHHQCIISIDVLCVYFNSYLVSLSIHYLRLIEILHVKIRKTVSKFVRHFYQNGVVMRNRNKSQHQIFNDNEGCSR